MARELHHAPALPNAGQLTQAEWESISAHTISGGAAGEVLYYDGSTIVTLPVGSNGQFLTLTAGLPAWTSTIPAGSFPLLAPAGTAGAPSYSWSAEATTGIYRRAALTMSFASGGTGYIEFNNGNLHLQASSALSWTSAALGSAVDLTLFRDAANTLAQRNGVTAQESRLYNTYTDSSNYERVTLLWSGNAFFIGTQAAGTGTARRTTLLSASDIYFRTVGADRWLINTSGHLLAATDNSFDIGASGATRPRNVYVAGSGTFGGTLGVGAAPFTYASISGNANGLTGTDIMVIRAGGTIPSSVTSSALGFYSQQTTAVAVFNTTLVVGYYADNAILGAGSSIGSLYGMLVKSQTRGTTANYGIYIEAPSGAVTNIGLYNAGTTTLVGNTTFSGQILAADGSVAAPSYSFASEVLGFYRAAADHIAMTRNGSTAQFAWGSTGFLIASALPIAWTATSDAIGGTTDLFLYRDAANVLAQRNSTTAQAFHIYGTYTDASNYERLFVGIVGTTYYVSQQHAGTGAARAVEFGNGNASRWQISTSGHWLAVADNTYDIGASGATRPRTVYVGSNVIVGQIGTVTASSLNLMINGVNRWQIDTSGHLIASTDNTFDIGAAGATRPRIGYFGSYLVVGPTSTVPSTFGTNGATLAVGTVISVNNSYNAGAGAAGLGARISFGAETTTEGVVDTMAAIGGVYTVATTGAVTGDLVFYTRLAGGVYTLSATFTSASVFKIAGTALRATTEGTNHLDIFNGTAPVGTLANGASLYCDAGEMWVMDAGGTPTQISPHDPDGYWWFNSRTRENKKLQIDVEKILRFVNDKYGLDMVREMEDAGIV